MPEYRPDEHRVESIDVVGSWLFAAAVVATLFVVVLPFGL